MKMTTKQSLLFAVSLAVIAVLYQVEVLTSRWEADDYALISVESNKMWKFLTNIENTKNWFQWVTDVRAVDSRPLSRGKRYEAIYKLPLLGEYAQGLQVIEYVVNKRLVIQSDSLLKPRFTINLERTDSNYLKVNLKLLFRRNSALFRVTLGPVLWLLSSQQIRQSLFLLKMLFPA